MGIECNGIVWIDWVEINWWRGYAWMRVYKFREMLLLLRLMMSWMSFCWDRDCDWNESLEICEIVYSMKDGKYQGDMQDGYLLMIESWCFF